MNDTLPLPTNDDNPPFAAGELPELKISRKSLPAGVASNVKQHVVFARDHSSSMSGHKVAELNQASDSLVIELGDPMNKDGFRVSVVDFNSAAQQIHFGEPAETLQLAPAHAGGGTNFIDALSLTLDTVRDFKHQPNDEGWNYLRPVVLFLSDGQASVTQQLVDELHEEAEVIAVAYGADAHQSTLSQIASDGQVHVVGTDGGALRKFLAEVGKTLSQAMQGNR